MIIVSDDNVMRLTKEKKNDGLGIYGYMDIYMDIWIYVDIIEGESNYLEMSRSGSVLGQS